MSAGFHCRRQPRCGHRPEKRSTSPDSSLYTATCTPLPTTSSHINHQQLMMPHYNSPQPRCLASWKCKHMDITGVGNESISLLPTKLIAYILQKTSLFNKKDAVQRNCCYSMSALQPLQCRFSCCRVAVATNSGVTSACASSTHNIWDCWLRHFVPNGRPKKKTLPFSG